jgi:hypothetical protein
MTHWKDVTAKRGEGLGGSKEKEGAGVSPEQYAEMKKNVDALWAQLAKATEERDYHQRRLVAWRSREVRVQVRKEGVDVLVPRIEIPMLSNDLLWENRGEGVNRLCLDGWVDG